jgi:agmatinase
MQIISFLAFGSLFVLAHGHPAHDDQVPLDYVKFPFQPIYRGRNGEGKLPSFSWKYRPHPSSVTGDAIFSGITTFAKLPWVQCLTRDREIPFDIAFIGAPFVSSFSNRVEGVILSQPFAGHWD